VDGPSNQQVRATELCTIAFPQEKAVGGKMIIYAYVVDTLESATRRPAMVCRGGRCSWARKARDTFGGCELRSRVTARNTS
jgi:hypothetical protein